jgi:hypothetical protein
MADEPFSVQLASIPDHDDLVAEIWLGDKQVAELRHEADGVRLQLYDAPNRACWDVPLEDFLAALHKARERLGARPS